MSEDRTWYPNTAKSSSIPPSSQHILALPILLEPAVAVLEESDREWRCESSSFFMAFAFAFSFFSIRLLLLCLETNYVKNLGIGDWGGSAWFFTPITTSSSKEKNLRIWALGFSLLCPSSINLSYTFFPLSLFVNSVFHEHGERLRIGKQRGQGRRTPCEGERRESRVFFFY